MPPSSPLAPDLESSYHHCCRVARQRARNFYYSFLALPGRKRRAMCAIYAFMRACDDLADGEVAGSRRDLLERWRGMLVSALEGDTSGSPVLPAFADTVRAHAIPPVYFHELIDGALMDLEVRRYATFQDLYRYCYHVASVVGLVCIHVFGFSDPRATEYAEWQGVAFQLTNILRDVAEDASLDRVYLPQEDLARFGYGEADLRAGVRDERFVGLMAFEADRAEDYYRKAAPLVSLVDPDSRAALRAMSSIYHGLLLEIRRRHFDVFTRRVRLSPARKLAVLGRALVTR